MVGCDDGTVLALDATGMPVQMSRITGIPTHIAAISDHSGTLVYMGSDKGQVKAFQIE